MGTIKKNSLLNPNIHVVKFPDGEIKSYAENMTAKNMYFQIDTDSYPHTIIESIVDYTKNDQAVTICDRYMKTCFINWTTVGWKLLVQLKGVKNSPFI